MPGRFAGLVSGVREDGGARGRVASRAGGRHGVGDRVSRRDRPPEAGRRILGRPAWANVDVDDLPLRVDGTVHRGPLAGDPDVRFIDVPGTPDAGAELARRILVEGANTWTQASIVKGATATTRSASSAATSA